MNRKGFMMAEVVVVSAIVLVTLVSFYVSYNKIISLYNQRVNYYDVTTLYELSYVRDNISDYSEYSSRDSVIDDEYEKVYYVKNTELGNMDVSNQTFKDYLKYIEDSVTFETDYILVMEKCKNEDIDNCKYAYLEVFENNSDNTNNNNGGGGSNTGTGSNQCTDLTNLSCCAQYCPSGLIADVSSGSCKCCVKDGSECTMIR